jgi:hypothetical protein
MAGPVADAQRVAVGRRLDRAADADAGAGAGDVLDHDGLAERDAHALAEDARQRVGRPAGRERHHHGDGARRILLGGDGSGQCDEHGRNGGRNSEPSHGIPPLGFVRRWSRLFVATEAHTADAHRARGDTEPCSRSQAARAVVL